MLDLSTSFSTPESRPYHRASSLRPLMEGHQEKCCCHFTRYLLHLICTDSCSLTDQLIENVSNFLEGGVVECCEGIRSNCWKSHVIWPDGDTVSLCSVWEVCGWLNSPSRKTSYASLALALTGNQTLRGLDLPQPNHLNYSLCEMIRGRDDCKSHYNPWSQLPLPRNGNRTS